MKKIKLNDCHLIYQLHELVLHFQGESIDWLRAIVSEARKSLQFGDLAELLSSSYDGEVRNLRANLVAAYIPSSIKR